MRNKSIDFTGMNIYIGLDVHKKSWSVTVLSDEIEHKTFNTSPCAEKLSKYLREHFPGGNYHSAYEAGFCGFGHHRKLLEYGINNMVVNASDVPSTNKEKTTKSDAIDSRKIAKALRSKNLRGIYVFDPQREELRSLARQRQVFQKDLRRYKQRIKSFLMYYNISIPYEIEGNNWSKAFEGWLGQLKMGTTHGDSVIENLFVGYRFHKSQVAQVSNELRATARKDCKEDYNLLRSVPGIGPLTSIAIITEIGDVNRFNRFNQLCSYVGIMPTCYSSGEVERIGSMTHRANHWLRTMIIEASWQAIRKDPAMLLYYKKHVKNGNGKRAIIKVARKLLRRIQFVLRNKQTYQLGIVN